MKINVKIKDIDSELLFRRLEIDIGNKRILTPENASYNDNPISGINEIYKKFSLDGESRTNNLNSFISSESYESQLNNTLKRLPQQNVNMFFVDYADMQIPENKHIEALSDIQYSYSDIVITPTCSKIVKDEDGESAINSFLDITNRFLDVSETLNNKGIIGTIPFKIPRLNIEDIVKNYCDRDITSFAIDLDGKCIQTTLPKMRMLMRLLKKYGINDEAFLYAINSYEGKFAKDAVEIPAKDFISTGFGIDILGMNHIPPRLPTNKWEEISHREKSYRLFDKEIYGYQKVSEKEALDLGLKNRTEINKYNNTEKFQETKQIKMILQEESTLEKYILTKSQIDEKTITDIKKMRKETFNKK
jgi:hypothetical protein